MIGFSYIYKSSEEIFSNFITLDTLSVGESIGIFISLGITLTSIFLIFPSIILFCTYSKKLAEKKHKKKILEQILVQKEIEDEIEKQVHLEERK